MKPLVSTAVITGLLRGEFLRTPSRSYLLSDLTEKTLCFGMIFCRWCGPCRLLTPRLETLATEKLDKFHLAKVDIDNIPELAEEYNVKKKKTIFIL